MKKNTLIAIGVYALVGYGAYQMFFSKRAYAKRIIAFGASTGTLDSLTKFDLGYLREWAKSAKTNSPRFSYKSINYNTKGGKAIK